MSPISRRKLITCGLAATAGCRRSDRGRPAGRAVWTHPARSRWLLRRRRDLTYATQRLLTAHSLAREFPRSMISKTPFANEVAPPNDAFKRHQASGFADWRLSVDGMVARPASLSLADLKSLPFRSQITEVTCEEGWSYIAEWIGTPLIEVLNAVGSCPRRAIVVYFSIDTAWWDSIDMADALHPQTLLTWG